MPVKLTLVVRADLGMGKGKIAAQVAHAAVAAVLRQHRSGHFLAWLREGQPKIVLKVGGEDEFWQVCAQAASAGLPVEVVRDAGRTQVVSGTPTCCAIGPAPDQEIDRVAGGLSLL